MKAARLNSFLLTRKGAAAPLSPLSPYSPPPSRGPDGAGEALCQDTLGRVRVSLRVDRERHLRLRLMAAHTRRTIQETLLAALDAHLADHGSDILGGHCACLVEGDDRRDVDCLKSGPARTPAAEV